MTYPPPEPPPQQYSGPPQQYSGPPSSGQPWSGPSYAPPPAYGDQPQYHAVPQYGMQPPPPADGSKTWIWVVSAVAAALLLCVGGVVTVLVAAGNFVEEVQRDAASPLLEPTPFGPSGGPFEPQPEETEPEPELLKLGETLVVTSDEGDAYEVTVKNRTFRKKGCDSFALKPENGGYLVADVTVKVTKGNADISPYDFDLVVADGSTVRNTAGVASGCGDDLDSVHSLKAGGRRSGQLVFDVGAAKGDITYNLDGAIVGSWKVG